MEVLFNGLRRLEYRGYDSAGISIDDDPVSINGYYLPTLPPLVFKQEGKIEQLVAGVYQGITLFPSEGHSAFQKLSCTSRRRKVMSIVYEQICLPNCENISQIDPAMRD